jgi:hypothetical protein
MTHCVPLELDTSTAIPVDSEVSVASKMSAGNE